MCGRFVQRYTWDDIQDLYDLPIGPTRELGTNRGTTRGINRASAPENGRNRELRQPPFSSAV
jgi:hypothetical protein